MNTEERTLLDSIQTALFALEMDSLGRPVYVAFNRTACQVAGRDADEILGRTAMDVYPGGLGRIAYQHHCEAMASREPATYELALPLRGLERQVRTHLEPVLAEDGSLIRLVGTSHDVSVEHVMREAQARSLLLKTDLEEFIKLAAHDLRTPIINVGILADMLRDGFQDLGDGKLELINMLENVADKAMLLIGDVLDHARVSNAPEAIEDFDIGVLCQNMLAVLDPTKQHKAIVTGSWVLGDKVATQVMLQNLIDNAIKHNADDSIVLSISAKAAGDNAYEITVEDNGVGLPDSVISFLNGGEYYGDNGIGLLGVRRLIKARGGRISATRHEHGTGGKVSLTLPGKFLGQLTNTQVD